MDYIIRTEGGDVVAVLIEAKTTFHTMFHHAVAQVCSHKSLPIPYSFRGVPNFVNFVVNLGVAKFSTHEYCELYACACTSRSHYEN